MAELMYLVAGLIVGSLLGFGFACICYCSGRSNEVIDSFNEGYLKGYLNGLGVGEKQNGSNTDKEIRRGNG